MGFRELPTTPHQEEDMPIHPFHVGDTVRRGRGKTLWTITEIDDHYISLLSTTDGWTKASVTTDKAHTLTRTTPHPGATR